MKNRKRKINILVLIIFFIGLIVLFYPMISNYYNSKRQKENISNYNNLISNINEDDYRNLIEEAKSYNDEVLNMIAPLIEYTNKNKEEKYYKILTTDDDGIIGIININKIRVNLPIYHGVESKTLDFGVGHLPGSSFPIGEKGTHAVLSAHRGLPSSRLFTDLNKLEIGDTFYISIFNQKFYYQIDQIKTVLPKEINNLKIEPYGEYVTLVTCTPYGINTHRLLVRGKRIDNIDDKINIITSDAYPIDKIKLISAIGFITFLIISLYIFIKPVKKGGKNHEKVIDNFISNHNDSN